jgi:fibronectin type 3 domain-containing protein
MRSTGRPGLTWLASTGPGVVSYKIYAKSPDAPFFTLIGSTAGTTFMTNDAWLDYRSTMATIYVVVAVKADGTESFFSNRALNKTNPLLKVDMAPILYLLLED